MTTLLDTNILSAILDENHVFHLWAVEVMEAQKLDGPTGIPDIVYTEASIVFESSAQLDVVLSRLGIDRIPASNIALFRAGRAYIDYKRNNKGEFKKGVLPDYTIGAIAECEQIPLMTTNPGDYTTYFPGVRLIQPPSDLMTSQRANIPKKRERKLPRYLEDLFEPQLLDDDPNGQTDEQ